LKIRLPGWAILGIGDLPKKEATTKYKRNCENHSFLEKISMASQYSVKAQPKRMKLMSRIWFILMSDRITFK
jgi:hypothetical protein